MKLKTRLLLAASLFLLGSEGRAVQPEPLPPSSVWGGSQFVQADRAGNVFFLRPDRLEVYPVSKTGALGAPAPLKASLSATGVVREAVMSLAGDRWMLLNGPTLRLFVDGKEKILPPLAWKPWSLAFQRDVPIVAVTPFPLGGRAVDVKRIGTPPWFLHLDADRWTPTVELKGVSVADFLENGGLNEAIAKNAVFMAGDRQGRLWVARQYGYRVQRFTPGGRLLLEILVGGGEVRSKARSPGIELKPRGGSQNPRDATQNPRNEKGTYFPFTAQRVVYALTQGRDGKVYFLVDAGGGAAALDRYDPVDSILERVPVSLKLKDSFTLAAGRDGLYLAAWNPADGRWRIPWSELDAARWRPVKGAQIDGFDPQADDQF